MVSQVTLSQVLLCPLCQTRFRFVKLGYVGLRPLGHVEAGCVKLSLVKLSPLS